MSAGYRWLISSALLAITCLPATASSAEEPAKPTPFDAGKVSVSGGATLTSRGDISYFVLSLGLGYYVLKGLNVGLGGTVMIGSGPTIGIVTPGTQYVFWMVPIIHPYLGGFYRHWFIGGPEEDFDTVGARAGLLHVSRHVQVGVGLVAETRLECPSLVKGCTDYYPELVLSFSF